jgi:hypothetical protein
VKKKLRGGSRSNSRPRIDCTAACASASVARRIRTPVAITRDSTGNKVGGLGP